MSDSPKQPAPDPQGPAEAALEAVRSKYGFIPNVLREMAASPAALHAYLAGQEAMARHGVLTPAEQQVVQLAVSQANGCRYCTAAHTALGRAAGVPDAELAAIARGGSPEDPRLAALVDAVRLLVEHRGWLDAGQVAALADRGLDRGTLYELVAFAGLKTISNSVNHLAGTPVDPELQAGT